MSRDIDYQITSEILQYNITENNNNCYMEVCINPSDRSVYLFNFNSVYQNMGCFTEFLKTNVEKLKQLYPNYFIYADCNPAGTGVSLKVGGKIIETFNRVSFQDPFEIQKEDF